MQPRSYISLCHLKNAGSGRSVTDAGSLKLTTRGSDVTLAQIRGEAILSTQAGDLRTSGIVGPCILQACGGLQKRAVLRVKLKRLDKLSENLARES